MKKIIFSLICLLMLVGNVYAVTASDKKLKISDYNTSNFTDILKSEGIKEEFESYKESDDQITIYMFRGQGCGYCKAFLTFLNSITDEYGKYFKLVGFEVWNDKANDKLMTSISSFMNNPAGGVPYIIIGDQVFPGYASSYDDSIKSAILNLYKSTDRYDVFEEYNKAVDRAVKAENGNAPTIIFWNFILLTASVIVVIMYINKQNRKIFNKLDEIQMKRK